MERRLPGGGCPSPSAARAVRSEAMPGWMRDNEREVDIVTGCFLLISLEFWKRLGGFDRAFFMYGEEVGPVPASCGGSARARDHARGDARPLRRRVRTDPRGQARARARRAARLMRVHWSATRRIPRRLADRPRLCEPRALGRGSSARSACATTRRRPPAGAPRGDRRREWMGRQGRHERSIRRRPHDHLQPARTTPASRCGGFSTRAPRRPASGCGTTAVMPRRSQSSKSLRGHPRFFRFHHSRENRKLREPTNWLWSHAAGRLPLEGRRRLPRAGRLDREAAARPRGRSRVRRDRLLALRGRGLHPRDREAKDPRLRRERFVAGQRAGWKEAAT